MEASEMVPAGGPGGPAVHGVAGIAVSGARSSPRAGLLVALARRGLLATLSRLEGHRLVLREADRATEIGDGTAPGALAASIEVHDAEFWPAVAFRGTVGAGESWMAGQWDCDQLVDLIRMLIRQRDVMSGVDSGLARLSMPLLRAAHAWRRNSRRGSRRNVADHYDLGNEFFALFLDESLTYSCGIFESPATSLADAQRAKIDRICRKLDLQPGESLLEIGTGWGAFAIHAARAYGARVTTTTISERQAEVARQRVREAGLADRVEVVVQDYRSLRGQYDKLVSVEMIEAVGHHFHRDYFRVCGERLAPHGLALIQAITIQDQEFERHKREVDFIKRYVFPGSCIPSVTAMLDAATRASDLRLFHLEEIGPHYATTLHHWRERFLARREEVRAQGFPEEFLRMWEFYLAYCEAGFSERYIGDVQLLLARPGARRQPVLGPV